MDQSIKDEIMYLANKIETLAQNAFDDYISNLKETFEEIASKADNIYRTVQDIEISEE